MDIALQFDPIQMRADMLLSRGSLVDGDDLGTAVILSLFTDRRALAEDTLPDASASRRGWWGDAFASTGPMGSRLWLLLREKQTRETVNRARDYAQEALNWLVEQGVARRVVVQTEVVRIGVLGLVIHIERNQMPPERYRWELPWNQLRA